MKVLPSLNFTGSMWDIMGFHGRSIKDMQEMAADCYCSAVGPVMTGKEEYIPHVLPVLISVPDMFMVCSFGEYFVTAVPARFRQVK
ncbi:hypothetical protein [Gluconacetobacter entanii]|uniref:hypothetical protein n=1 Tax=Gluconacetobacter entanii TaxID=108528 RepID=UPI0011B3F15F|nr:hypothetical protein [Gluconacetobacter entanii]MCE2577314.1 hypothetical protein [Komagataeibacter sp. FNDCR1]